MSFTSSTQFSPKHTQLKVATKAVDIKSDGTNEGEEYTYKKDETDRSKIECFWDDVRFKRAWHFQQMR